MKNFLTMAIPLKSLEDIIRIKFPHAIVKINDLVGDLDHLSLEITDEQFRGLSLIAQHRLVKSTLSELLHSKLHAITIKTKVPE